MADPLVSPEPSDEEAAAIMAALSMTWPRAAASHPPEAPSRWRFSGRWWTKPVATRRDRP